MKTRTLIPALLIALTVTACEAGGPAEPATRNADGESARLHILADDLAGTLPSELSDEEARGLLLMREEEKLARDVYQYFYERYALRIFENIASSEQRHMDAVNTLLDRYGLPDPVADDSRGVFTDQRFMTLYAQLTGAGSAGLLDALLAGATIEDLDIEDLMDLSVDADNEDILLVYGNLTRGSRNHLRAFYAQITRNGGNYAAQYITQELFDEIVNSPTERGRR